MDGFEKFSVNSSGTRFKGVIRTGFTGVEQLCSAPDNDPGAEIFKNSRKICAAAVNGFFVKRFNLPGVWNQFRRNFKCGRPQIILKMSEALRLAGVNTPAVHAAVSGFCRLRRRDYLVSDLVPENFIQLDRIPEAQMTQLQVWEIIENSVIPEVVKMHRNGIVHGDLSLRNIYTGDGRIVFIDLDSTVQYIKGISDRDRCREIARLISSFCRSYTSIPADGLIAPAAEAYRKHSGFMPDEKCLRREVNYFIDNHKYIRI